METCVFLFQYDSHHPDKRACVQVAMQQQELQNPHKLMVGGVRGGATCSAILYTWQWDHPRYYTIVQLRTM